MKLVVVDRELRCDSCGGPTEPVDMEDPEGQWECLACGEKEEVTA